MRSEIGTITSKGTTTIPVTLRRELSLEPGDRVAFEIQGEAILLRKVKPLDMAYYSSIQSQFSEEWDSDLDAEAFDDL